MTDQHYDLFAAQLKNTGNSFGLYGSNKASGYTKIARVGKNAMLLNHVNFLAPYSAVPSGSYLYYKTWLVAPGNGKNDDVWVETGVLSVNEKGCGENYWEFDPTNVAQTGSGLDTFLWSAVTVHTSGEELENRREVILKGTLEHYRGRSKYLGLNKFEPLNPPLPDHQWWELPQGEPGVPPRHWFAWPENAIRKSTSHLHREHKQIVGVKLDQGKVEYLVHGVLGRLNRSDQPYGGKTGYVYWHPASGQSGTVGFWLIYIDPTTGEAAFPMQPTKIRNDGN